MFIQLLINNINLLLFQLFCISFPFSNDIFILLGNFSFCFIMSSLKNILLYLLFTSFNNSSSLSFKTFLIFVNIFEYLFLILLYFYQSFQILFLIHLFFVLNQ